MTTQTARAVLHRVEVRPRAVAGDPGADRLVREAAALGIRLSDARTAKVYLIEGSLSDDDLARVVDAVLVDPVIESGSVGATQAGEGSVLVEVHPKPGVMDPAAATVADAVERLTGIPVQVSTARRFELAGVDGDQADAIARRLLANPVIHDIHTAPFRPDALPHGHSGEFRLTHVPIRDLEDAALETLSRDAHLFLSLDEMRAIRDEYRTLDREPTDIELETLAQTWSEHCVHKTLKSTIRYVETAPSGIEWAGRPGHEVHDDGSVTIHNLLKSTVAAATHELIAEDPDGIGAWCLSVFVDNAGIVGFDDDHAVCVKVETHNHPSAIEPYGGAATGIGGCIRDIIGTGLAAKPIASTDVFCVGTPDIATVPPGCIHPTRILSEVVSGVRDYGNRMGIPTLNGAVWYDDRHVGNPLVYCGCVGVMPRDLIGGEPEPGDRIIAVGGRTGRDGIHGATFSSAELTDTHADEFAHAVQIGNAIEEKRVLDAILRARDVEGGPLFTAITDCGAGGFSSAVGEMGESLGAEVDLENAPLKYEGLTYTEIWISEAQERMVLAVPETNLDAFRAICDEEHVEMADLGRFGTEGADLVLRYHGTEVGRLPMAFLHEGMPQPTRDASWEPRAPGPVEVRDAPPMGDTLLTLLAHPNIASKHGIIRQYDHEVQGNTIVRPLVGPGGRGPGDAAVIEPVPGSGQGLAIGCGLATGLEADPYLMTLAAIDECVRNLVCVGADPERIAILDNFCWPSCKKPENLGSLVRAAEGCYDGAKAYRTPFVSGKDSLNNQFTTADGTTIEIPPTLLISGIGIVTEVSSCVTMDAKAPGNALVLVGTPQDALGGSHLERCVGLAAGADASLPRVDLAEGPRVARLVASLIASGAVRSAHDVSDGGLLVAVAEMLIAGSSTAESIGFAFDDSVHGMIHRSGFAEFPSAYVLEVSPDRVGEVAGLAEGCATVLGVLDASGELDLGSGSSVGVERMAVAWRGEGAV